MTNNNEKKEYTFLNLKESVGKNGNYISCTAECLVTRMRTGQTNNGKNYVNFTAPIKNRTNLIEKMTKTRPAEDANGTVWASVTLYDNEYNQLATRFQNMKAIKEGKTVVLIITGKINVERKTSNDGRTFINCNITADDFDVKRSLPPKNGSNNAPQSNNNTYAQGYAQNTTPYNAPPVQNAGTVAYQNQNHMPAPNPAGYIPDGNNGFIAISEDLDADIPF